MNNPLKSSADYEYFLYTLKESFPLIISSTVVFIRLGATLARVHGELCFEDDFKLVVRERILFHRLPPLIDWYGYEIWQGKEKLFWYDCQPHPDDVTLSKTHPHHKHIHPNIKHNRVIAPLMSFSRPNIPILINEIEKFIKEKGK